MERMIKHTFSALIALLLVAASLADLQAQQSDYEIQQNFRNDYNQIVNWIDNAVASSDIREIEQRIREFVSEYSDHTSIINAALYPETAQQRIDGLRARFNAARDKIATIENLNRRIDALNAEMQEFRDRIAEMDEAREALERQLRDSQAGERRVAAMAREYRENLQERDEFVTGFIAELLQRYDAVDAATSSDLADMIERLDDNPVDLLRTILGEYVNYANRATGLTAPEYMSMKAQHIYFSQWWDSIGERLTDVFAEAPVQARQEVSDLLANWNSAIDNRIWGAISGAFSDSNVNLDSFSSANALYSSIRSYVERAIETSREQNSQEDLDRYRNFTGFWNGTVKSQWGDLLIASEVLSYEHVASIDTLLETWNVEAIPTSNLMLILFLASIAVIIGLIIALVRKRGGTEEE